MIEEDESEFLAQQMQNESFGGAPSNNYNNKPMADNREQVRKADTQRVQQLVGGDDDFGGSQPRRLPQPRATGDASLDAAI